MKKFFITSALALIFSFNAKAIEFRPYISGKVNSNFVKFSTKLNSIDEEDGDIINLSEDFNKNTFGGSIAIGFSGSSNSLPLRAEFEFSMLSKMKKTIFADIIGLETKLNTYYLNFYYDFYNLNDNFVPYVNLGLGLATADVSLKDFFDDEPEDEDFKKTAFAWRVGVGSYYKITNNLSADFGVKYSQALFDKSIDLDIDMITLSLGLRCSF